jgi:peptidoglycan/xylan/chitin deacetylase (PgdA/CDA1 family)
MSVHRPVLSFMAGMFPSSLLYRTVNSVIINPFYHTVSDEYLPHIHPLYKPKTIKAFEKEIDFLCRYFEAVDMEAVFSAQNGGPEKNAFHLSFDDGLRGIYENVLPLLVQKGIPATIFVNSDFVDNHLLFYRHKAALLIDQLNRHRVSNATQREIANRLGVDFSQKHSLHAYILHLPYSEKNRLDAVAPLLDVDFQAYLKENKPYLTVPELKEMQKKGFTIGAHSMNHPPFGELDESEQIRQTVESCNYVRETFKERRSYFSFPFSDRGIRDSFFKAIDSQVDLCFGINGISIQQGGKLIGRMDMEKNGRNAREIINKSFLKYRICCKYTARGIVLWINR